MRETDYKKPNPTKFSANSVKRSISIYVRRIIVGDVPNALASVTCYGSHKNVHAYTSVLNPWICRKISPDATDCCA